MAEERTSAQLLERLRNEQRKRWEGGERVLAETLLQHHVTLQANADCALELVYNEMLLREKFGDPPQLEEYVERFPQFAPGLKRLFEVHQVLESGGTLDGTPLEGTPGTSTADLPAVPGYEVLREVGRGGMGIVYEAWQIGLNRPTAIKMILAGDHASPQELARFQTEAEAVGRLQHPNIVQIYEVGESKGRPYLSMEYVAGGSLGQKLQGVPLAARSAAELLETLARAMHHAHERGILHRDLTPGNVLLAEDGVPKIVDFGLAKLLGAGPVIHTQTGVVVGTPSYMAPEQAWGKTKEIGIAADVYALGAILYELLTGRPPFRAETPLETVLQVQSVDPVSPSRLQPKLPRDLATICLQCLQKEPRRRYADAGALANDLRSFLEGKTIQARPTGTWVRTLKWAQRRPAVAALLALVVFVTALGFGLVTWQWQRAEAAGQEAVGKARELEVKNYRQDLALAERELSVNNVGRAEEILDACPVGLRDWEWHCLKRLRYGDLRALQQYPVAVYSPVFSPDGRYLAAGARNGTVKISDVATGKELLAPNMPNHNIRSVAYSPDGQRLVTAGLDGRIIVWKTTTGEVLRTLKGHEGPVGHALFSPDGNRIASSSWDYTVKLWDLATGREIRTFSGYRGAPAVAGFLSGGRCLVTTSAGGTVILWDTTTFREIWSFRDQIDWLASRALSHDGQRLALGGQDGLVTVWDLATGQRTLTLSGHTLKVGGLAFSHDDRRLVSGGYDKSLKVWDTTTGQETLTLHGHADSITGVSFSPNGQQLASASEDGTVKIWDATPLPQEERDQQVLTLRGLSQRVLGVAFSPDSQRLASAGWDGTVKIWDALTGQEALTFRGHSAYVWSVAFSPDGRHVASTGWDFHVRVWDAASGQEIHKLPGKGGYIFSVAFDPDGRQLAAGTSVGKVKMWDPTTGQEVRTLPAHDSATILSVAFSPDGRRFASADWDGVVKVWDATTWNSNPLRALRGHRGPVRCVAFSPDSRRLASAGEDGAAKVWDVETGEEILSLRHSDRVYSVAFSPDGRRLASGGWDQIVRIWDATTGDKLPTLPGHAGYVWSIAFSPDGKRLASASGYAGRGEIKLWDTSLWDKDPSPKRQAPEK